MCRIRSMSLQAQLSAMIFLMFPSGTCRRPQVTGVEMRRPVTQSLAVAGVSVISRAQGGACASELGGGLKPRAPLELFSL